MIGFILFFEKKDPAMTYIKRDQSQHAERAVDQLPVKRNFTDRAGNKCEWKDHDTGDHSKTDHPDISHRIHERTDKRHSYYQVCKCQPVGSIGKMRIMKVGILYFGID